MVTVPAIGTVYVILNQKLIIGICKDSYYTTKSIADAEYTEKKSRFIGHCCPISSVAEAEELIAFYKKKYWDARHNCYAFRIGDSARSSDDGEPSGTAGVPILNVLTQTQVTDTLIVVTRYFGGILLGAGGLVRAYSKTAKDALSASGIICMEPCIRLEVNAPYTLFTAVEKVLRENDLDIDAQYSDTVHVISYVPIRLTDLIIDRIIDRTDGKCMPCKGDIKYLPFAVSSNGIKENENA